MCKQGRARADAQEYMHHRPLRRQSEKRPQPANVIIPREIGLVIPINTQCLPRGEGRNRLLNPITLDADSSTPPRRIASSLGHFQKLQFPISCITCSSKTRHTGLKVRESGNGVSHEGIRGALQEARLESGPPL